ncbi:hypothetical protein SAMN02745866_04068 [Alteromonadaceae bacterium Bs31]|nr:hypothetical protein SAMN02745866_04068 [Alteromonadaceae bacterium Bs31]
MNTLSILRHSILLLLLLLAFGSFAQDSTEQQQSRIDFGNAYIQGQSIKSGAVYLTNRRKSKVESLLKTRKDYRYEIVKDFYNGDIEISDDSLKAEQGSEAETDK